MNMLTIENWWLLFVCAECVWKKYRLIYRNYVLSSSIVEFSHNNIFRLLLVHVPRTFEEH